MARIRLQAFPAQFTPTPFQNLAYIAEKKQAREDKAFDLETTLESEFNKIGALPVDAEERNTIINSFRNELSSVYEQNKNNPNNLLDGFKQVQRKFNQELNYGKLGGINKRYQGYTESQKKYSDLSNKYIESGGEKGLSPEEAELYLNSEVTKLNATPIQQTPFGTWESYKEESIHPTLNLSKIADSIGKEMRDKPQLITQFTGLQNAGGGYYRDVVTKREFTEAQAIQQAVIARMKTDPTIQGYNNARNRITDKPEILKQYLNTAAQAAQFNPEVYTINGKSYNPNDPEAKSMFEANVADAFLNEDIYNAATTAANIYQLDRTDFSPSYHKNWIYEKQLDKEESSTAINLNIPYTQATGSITNTLNNLDNIGVPGEKGMYDIPNAPRSGYNEFIGTKEVSVTPQDWASNYDNLPFIDKQRVEYIKSQIPELKDKDPKLFTVNERTQVIDRLKSLQDVKVSAQLKAYKDAKFRKSQGDFYNANMEQFVFYDPTNSIGTNKNGVYTGAELRRNGFNIDELIGNISNSNIIPTQIAGVSYTFATPDVVNATRKGTSTDRDTGVQLYVGKNRAQVDSDYRLSAFENALAIATNLKVPYPLFNNPDIIVIPKGTFEYDIKLSTGNTVPLKGAKTPEQFRTSIINLYNSSPALRQLIDTSIFGKEE